MSVTTTYLYPVNSATAPTAAQSAAVNQVIAQVNWADADASAIITHNLAMSIADLALGYPMVTVNVEGASTNVAIVAVSRTANTVTISKSTNVGSNSTLVVVISRPMSMFR